MEMMKKMMECMGSMSEEEREKVMENCFSFMREKSGSTSDEEQGKESAGSEKQSEMKGCCPGMLEKFSSMMMSCCRQ